MSIRRKTKPAKKPSTRKSRWSTPRVRVPAQDAAPPSPVLTPPILSPRNPGSNDRTQACRSCRYWHRFCDDLRQLSDTGYCRRFPPQRSNPQETVDGTIIQRAVPPTVGGNSWCGEWRHWEATTK